MRKDFGVKTFVYPMPVFIVAAYDKNGKQNCMNAAWLIKRKLLLTGARPALPYWQTNR